MKKIKITKLVTFKYFPILFLKIECLTKDINKFLYKKVEIYFIFLKMIFKDFKI